MADESCRVAVILLCGIPASGKSTLAKKIQEYVQETRGDAMHVLHVCYDDFIPSDLDVNEGIDATQLHDLEGAVYDNSVDEKGNTQSHDGAINYSTHSLWKQYRKRVLEAVEGVLNMIENQDKAGSFDSSVVVEGLKMEGLPSFHEFWNTFQKRIFSEEKNCSCFTSTVCRWSGCAHVILVDDNMYYHSMRYEYFQLARKYGAGFAEVFLECPLEIAMKRNSSRSNPVSSNTMETMFHNMEHPDPDKFPWEQHYLTLKTEEELDTETMECVAQLAIVALKHPVTQAVEEDFEEKEKSRLACITSIIYQADQVLRKYITMVITEFKGNGKGKKELQSLASQLNKDKKAFLESLHNIKSQPECDKKIKSMSPPVKCCVFYETKSTADKTCQGATSTSYCPTERTTVTSSKQSFTKHLIVGEKESANMEENNAHDRFAISKETHSCFTTSRKHLCLHCFPIVDDKEEFRLFVEELFKTQQTRHYVS